MMFDVIVLAAGKGSRMKSALPKVLHPIAGKPMLKWATDAAAASGAQNTHVVIGFGREQVVAGMAGEPVTFAIQREQLGTGHAVAQAMENVSDVDVVVITYGDVPLLRSTTISRLAALAAQQQLVLLTEFLEVPDGYGRIVRAPSGGVQAIVEQKDATEEQRRINEVNSGVMAVPATQLREWLPKLSSSNAQGEYYLTDIVAMAAQAGVPIEAVHPSEAHETTGVNSREQLSALERAYQRQMAADLMADGVTILDPARIDVRGKLQAAQDVSIDVNCIFEGDVVLEAGVNIQANCIIRNARIGANTCIEANSIIEGSTVAANCGVGPFARLRPGSELGENAKVGNFVEVKKSIVGAGSKINHLSYVGDASIGKSTNIGAGVITCNYDGVNKHRTAIGDEAFVGSNCALVAPVEIGSGVTVGAGSVVTDDVPEGNLTVARGRQKNIAGWERPKKS
ncbi:bifunctional UDP-N-acetylglucosamine diphosphorylase/glucosamine-1-phosphate N-acetyltransferase GlmU [Spongiibacter marinus]|uniref:bifunctional UDP-N-acetylglucosamine diphosphorylase/glucosamine-1-phosphate N-acetyltransferase GlmU n=1 Tax=Spongiibacter marinus TaxID=354246 RepID=UPI003C669225